MCRARGALSKNQWLELDCTFVSFRLTPDFLAMLPVAFPYFSEQNGATGWRDSDALFVAMKKWLTLSMLLTSFQVRRPCINEAVCS